MQWWGAGEPFILFYLRSKMVWLTTIIFLFPPPINHATQPLLLIGMVELILAQFDLVLFLTGCSAFISQNPEKIPLNFGEISGANGTDEWTEVL